MLKIIVLLIIVYFLTENDTLPMVPTGKIKIKLRIHQTAMVLLFCMFFIKAITMIYQEVMLL